MTRRIDQSEHNLKAFSMARPKIWEWIEKASPEFEFAESLRNYIAKHGDLTEPQRVAAKRCMARAEERAKRDAERHQEAVAKASGVSHDKVKLALLKAKQGGHRRARFRGMYDGVCVEFAMAPADGTNAGSVYVKCDSQYVGKIVNGAFYAMGDVRIDWLEAIRVCSEDPEGSAIRYGRETNICSCCSRQLTNPLSVELGIGPVCRANFF